MKNKIIDFFKSKIIIKITGRNIDNFIEKLIKNNLEILDMNYINHKEITIKIYEKDYEKLLKIKSIYDIEIRDFTGLIKIKNILNYNKIMIISFFIGIILLFSLSRFIYKIEVIHNDSEIRELILKELNLNGIKTNSLKKSTKTIDEIKEKIKKKYKDKIEWLEIIEIGTKYIVRVEERKIVNIEDKNKKKHIIAKKDAIIKKVTASSGEIIKDVNSYVKKGEIIISGDIKLNEEIKNTVDAEGTVYGEVWYKVKITVPLAYYEEIYTSNYLTNYNFEFINKKVSLKKGFENKKEEKINIFKHLFLPISFNKIKEKEIKNIEKKYTIDQAIKEGIKKTKQKLEETLQEEEYIINEKQLKVNVKDSKIELEMFYTVYENITDILYIE